MHACTMHPVHMYISNEYYSIDDLLKNFFVVESTKSVDALDKLPRNTPATASIALIVSAVDSVGFVPQCCLSSRNTMMQAVVKIAINASQNEIINVLRIHFQNGSP